MRPITLRLPDSLLSDLETEADKAGFSSRSEYIRHLLQNREVIRKQVIPSFDSNTDRTDLVEDLSERVDDLSVTVEDIDARLQAVEKQSLQDDADTSQPTGQQAELAEEEVTAKADENAEWQTHLKDWLDENGPGSSEAQHIIFDAAVKLDEEGAMQTGDLKTYLYDQHSDGYKSAQTMRVATVERYYEDVPGFSKPEYGKYSFEKSDLR